MRIRVRVQRRVREYELKYVCCKCGESFYYRQEVQDHVNGHR